MIRDVKKKKKRFLFSRLTWSHGCHILHLWIFNAVWKFIFNILKSYMTQVIGTFLSKWNNKNVKLHSISLTLKPLHFAILKDCQDLFYSISTTISEVTYVNLHANRQTVFQSCYGTWNLSMYWPLSEEGFITETVLKGQTQATSLPTVWFSLFFLT